MLIQHQKKCQSTHFKFYPDAVLLKVLENKHAILDKKIHYVGEKKYVVNSYPIYIGNKFAGAFSVFKDIQEIDELNKSKIPRITFNYK